MTDLLEGYRPRRLLYRQGEWTLETVRLVSTGDGVLQPRSTRFAGEPAIIEAMTRSRTGKGLVPCTRALLASAPPAEETGFELLEGRWVPVRLTPSIIRELEAPERRSGQEAALRAELSIVRAAYESLLQRVRQIEALVGAAEAAPARAAPAGVPAASSAAPPAGPSSVPALEGRSPVPSSEATGPSQNEPRTPPDGEGRPASAGDVALPADREPLGLPMPEAVEASLAGLLGRDVPLREDLDLGTPWLDEPAGYHCARLMDSGGIDVGALLFETEAMVRLGSGLLNLSESDIEEQLRSGAAAPDTLAAGSEICGNLTGPLNEVSGNDGIRCTSLVPLGQAMPGWLRDSVAHMVLRLRAGGFFVYISR